MDSVNQQLAQHQPLAASAQPQAEPEGLPRRAVGRGTHSPGVAGSVDEQPRSISERGESGESEIFPIKMAPCRRVDTAKFEQVLAAGREWTAAALAACEVG